MSNNVELYQSWIVSVNGSDETEVKVVFKSKNMIGLKKPDNTPYYYAPEEITWVREVEDAKV